MTEEFAKFIVEAKQNTYASGNKPVKIDDNFDEFVYEKGIYRYRDRFFGSNPFIGQEIVFGSELPIWGMNYFGKLAHPKVDSVSIYNFLRKALMEVDEEFPVRGPNRFSIRDLEYRNEPAGDLEDFVGSEYIWYDNETIYTLVYSGGLIKK